MLEESLLLKALHRYDRLTGRVVDELQIVRNALSPSIKEGTLVDVGAHQGSSSLPFAQEGWRIVAVEPDAANLERLEQQLAGYPNVRVVAQAVSDRAESEMPFYSSDVSSGISSLIPFHESHREVRRLSTTTLEHLLSELEIEKVDILKTDTEGYDLQALRGFPWSRIRPSVVVCEFEDAKTRHVGYGFDDLAQFLVDQEYSVLVSEWYPVVEYGRRHRWRHLSTFPCELLHPMAWGNFIATTSVELSLDIATRFPGKYSD